MKYKYHLQAIIVTLLWSSSFIIIKIGLEEIPPLLFAGSRYLFAFIILLFFLISRPDRNQIRRAGKKEIIEMCILGFLFYTLTQGLLFIGLSYLPSASVSLILNFTPVLVALFSTAILNESVSRYQWQGIALFIAGVLIYFLPGDSRIGESIGIIVMIAAALVNAASSLLGRRINKNGNYNPLFITAVSMGFGALLLFIPSAFHYGIPEVSTQNIILFIWMSVVNTAYAFTLWNNTLKHISAAESSIINSTMLFQVAILSYIFLGEPLESFEIAGMIVAISGAVIVQLYSVLRSR